MTELTRFGEVLMDLMADRGYTLSELVEKSAALGYYLDDDVLFSHCVEWNTFPQGAKYVRGPAHALSLDAEETAELGVAYLFDK